MYVRNLPEGTTEDDLYKVFSDHGVVLAAQVKQDKDDGARTFAFVNFMTAGQASKAKQ